jgi:hypothetical protein
MDSRTVFVFVTLVAVCLANFDQHTLEGKGFLKAVPAPLRDIASPRGV